MSFEIRASSTSKFRFLFFELQAFGKNMENYRNSRGFLQIFWFNLPKKKIPEKKSAGR